MNSLKELKDLVQETVDKGITSVEEIHREIMNQPFNIIERMVPPDVPVRRIRTIQEQVIGTVYEMIRAVNKTVGDIADGILAYEKCEHSSPAQNRRHSASVKSKKPYERNRKQQ